MSAILGPYKGYVAEVEVDTEAGVLFGQVLDLRDVITFQGETVEETLRAFYESIDDYLAYCEELGEKPEKPFSGNIAFRTKPETHRMISTAAQLQGKSINAWMDEQLTAAAERTIEAATNRQVEA